MAVDWSSRSVEEHRQFIVNELAPAEVHFADKLAVAGCGTEGVGR